MHQKCTHVVFYHGKCPDGIAAAWAVKEILGEKAEYIPMEYTTSPPDVTGKEVIIVDFSFKPITMKIMEEQAASVTLLDHHESAKNMLSDYQCICPGTHLEFDMARSGAMMAWNHYHPGKEPPKVIHHIQDRDLWAWKDPKTNAFVRQFDTLPLTFETMDAIAAMNEAQYEQFVERGQGLVDQFNTFCNGFVELAQPISMDGVQGLCVSASAHFTSDVGNLLAKKTGTMGCIWYVQKPGVVKVGLRAIGDTNVSEIAARFGGGGHKHAAAFLLPVDKIPALIAGALNSPEYEASQILGMPHHG